jgi:hypothetical protein
MTDIEVLYIEHKSALLCCTRHFCRQIRYRAPLSLKGNFDLASSLNPLNFLYLSGLVFIKKMAFDHLT